MTHGALAWSQLKLGLTVLAYLFGTFWGICFLCGIIKSKKEIMGNLKSKLDLSTSEKFIFGFFGILFLTAYVLN